MSNLPSLRLPPFLLATLAVAALAAAPADAYRYRVLARTGDLLDGEPIRSLSTPVLGDDGSFAYVAYTLHGRAVVDKDGIVAADGGEIDGRVVAVVSRPSVNRWGTVAFLAGFQEGGWAISTRDGVLIDSSVLIDGRPMTNVTLGPDFLGDSGGLMLQGLLFDGSSSEEVIVAGGEVLERTRNGDPLGRTFSEGWNQSGNVLFVNVPESGPRELRTRDGFVVREGDIVDGLRVGVVTTSAINDRGQVAFVDVGSARERPTDRLFVDGSHRLSSGDFVAGRRLRTFVVRRLNDAGTVLLAAFHDYEYPVEMPPTAPLPPALFTDTDFVAGPGSVIGGEVLDAADGGMLNERGQIIFRGWYPGGRMIVLATPDAACGLGFELAFLAGAAPLVRRLGAWRRRAVRPTGTSQSTLFSTS